MSIRSGLCASRWLCVALAIALFSGPAEGAAQGPVDGVTAGAAVGYIPDTRHLAFHVSIPLVGRLSALATANRWREVEVFCTLSCGVVNSGWSFGAGLRSIPWRTASRRFGVVVEVDAGVHRFRDPWPRGGETVPYVGGRLGLHQEIAGPISVEGSLRLERTNEFNYMDDLAGSLVTATASPRTLSAFELRVVVSTGAPEEGR